MMSHFFGRLPREGYEHFYGRDAFKNFLSILLLPTQMNMKRTLPQIICEMCTQQKDISQLSVTAGNVGFKPRNNIIWVKRPGVIQDSINDLMDFYGYKDMMSMFSGEELEFFFGMEDRFGGILTRTISKENIFDLRRLSEWGEKLEEVRDFKLPHAFYQEISRKFEISIYDIDNIVDEIHNKTYINPLLLPYYENLEKERRSDRVLSDKLGKIADLL